MWGLRRRDRSQRASHDAMVKDPRPAWSIYLKVATTLFWVGVHTVQHHVERFLGIVVKIAMGQGDDQR